MIRIRRCHPHIETAAPTTRSPHDPSWKFNDRFNRSPTPAHPRRSRTNHPSRSRAPRPPKRSSPSQPHEGGESRRLRPKDRSRRNCAPLLPGVATVPPETELRTRIDQPSPRRTTRLGVKGHNTSRLAAQIIPFDPDATPPAILPTPVSLYPPPHLGACPSPSDTSRLAAQIILFSSAAPPPAPATDYPMSLYALPPHPRADLPRRNTSRPPRSSSSTRLPRRQLSCQRPCPRTPHHAAPRSRSTSLQHLTPCRPDPPRRTSEPNRGTPLASPADPANFNLSNCFPTTVFSPIQMDAATVTVISGNLVMPKNRFPLRTLQTSHCQLFFQARQHLSVENSAVQD
jgi:hypothetical protein